MMNSKQIVLKSFSEYLQSEEYRLLEESRREKYQNNKSYTDIEVNEALNNPVDINWRHNNGSDIYGDFVVDNTNYLIVGSTILHGFMAYKFKIEIDGSYSTELTNTNGAEKFRVLPTIKDSIEFLLDELDINGIIFGAIDDSKGRKSLYERFCIYYTQKNTTHSYNKTVFVDNYKGEEISAHIFTIYKNNLSISVLNDVKNYILSEKLKAVGV